MGEIGPIHGLWPWEVGRNRAIYHPKGESMQQMNQYQPKVGYDLALHPKTWPKAMWRCMKDGYVEM